MWVLSWQAFRPLLLFCHNLSFLFVSFVLSSMCHALFLCLTCLRFVFEPLYDKCSALCTLYWSRQAFAKMPQTNVKEGCVGAPRRPLQFHSLRVSSSSKTPAQEMSDTLTAFSLSFLFSVFVWLILWRRIPHSFHFILPAQALWLPTVLTCTRLVWAIDKAACHWCVVKEFLCGS